MKWNEAYDLMTSEMSKKFGNEKPYASVQWKGTNVCADLYCPCGFHGHVDGDFMYYYRCVACGQIYAVGDRFMLVPISEPVEGFIQPKESSPDSDEDEIEYSFVEMERKRIVDGLHAALRLHEAGLGLDDQALTLAREILNLEKRE